MEPLLSLSKLQQFKQYFCFLRIGKKKRWKWKAFRDLCGWWDVHMDKMQFPLTKQLECVNGLLLTNPLLCIAFVFKRNYLLKLPLMQWITFGLTKKEPVGYYTSSHLNPVLSSRLSSSSSPSFSWSLSLLSACCFMNGQYTSSFSSISASRRWPRILKAAITLSSE